MMLATVLAARICDYCDKGRPKEKKDGVCRKLVNNSVQRTDQIRDIGESQGDAVDGVGGSTTERCWKREDALRMMS